MQSCSAQVPNQVAGVILVDGSTPELLHRASLPTRLWERMKQFTMPLGLPRWRGWCGGRLEEISAEKAALTCRSQFFETIGREDSAFARTAGEMNAIASLGNLPLVVIARDPARGQNPAAEARNNQLQRKSAKLSTNSQFVVAEGSAHDVPLARPDVVVEAVRSLLKPREQAGSRGTP